MFNFSPVLRENYRLGLPCHSRIRCIFSTDDISYGGDGTKLRGTTTKPIPSHGFSRSLTVTIAPMSAAFYEVKHLQLKGDE